MAGWNDALVGVPVGSRVMLVIPPALGYGPSGGQPSAGIKKNDTLVFVIDVLGEQPASLVPALERLGELSAGQEGGEQLGQQARVEALGTGQHVGDGPPAGLDVLLALVGRAPAIGDQWPVGAEPDRDDHLVLQPPDAAGGPGGHPPPARRALPGPGATTRPVSSASSRAAAC